MEKGVLLQCRKACLESGEQPAARGTGGRNDAQYRAQEKALDEGVVEQSRAEVLLLVLVLGGLGVSMGRPRTLTRPR
jgi:hypothetical protein